MINLTDWKEIHKRYNYPHPTAIKKRIKEKRYVATTEDFDIVNAITLWKYNREVEISIGTVERLNSVTRAVNTPQEAISNPHVADLINELLSTKGIALALTSAILKLYQPKAFPIIDQRSYNQIYCKKLPQNAAVEIYLKYVADCISIGDKFKIAFDKIDEVLYQKDKEEGHIL